MKRADGLSVMATGVLVLMALALAMTVGAAWAEGAEADSAPASRIDQRVDVCGYLVWLWLLIAALAYVLVLKIREGARVRAMGHSAGKPQKSGRRQDD